MTLPSMVEPGRVTEEKLPRRDWFLLPLISLLTIVVLTGSVELIARRLFTKLPKLGESCMVLNNPATGALGIPNCVCWEKIPEGSLTEYRFNSSGFRDVEFGPKAPGTFRIVMVGTSIAGGFRVPRQQTFAALLPAELARRTGRKVELYNEGLPWRSPPIIAQHFDAVLSAKPDLILWVLTPTDISRTSWVAPGPAPEPVTAKPAGFKAKLLSHVKAALAEKSFSAAAGKIFGRTSDVLDSSDLVLHDLLYESQSQYVKSSLMDASSDPEKMFLKSETSAEWRQRLADFDRNAAEIEEQSRAAGVPFMAALVPDRTLAAMVSLMSECPKGFNPYKLDDELRSIIVSHGGTYLDILPEFRFIPNPHLMYFAMDGHPNEQAHATITRLLVDRLTSGVIPALKVATQLQAGLASQK